MTDPAQKAMPFSDDAEKGLLSCLIFSPTELVPDAMSTMQPEWFYHPSNRLLFEHLSMMFQSQKPIEFPSITEHLQTHGVLDRVGGAGAISELLDFVPAPTHYAHYKGILRSKWLLRDVIESAQKTLSDAFTSEASEDVTAFLSTAESRVFETLQKAQHGDTERNRPHHIRVHVDAWLNEKQERWRNKGKMTGICTGLVDLDRSLHGLDDREGEVVVVAARPGQGKTALLISMLHNIAVQSRVPTLFFSIEMTSSQVNDRLVLGSMGINTSKGHSGMFSRDEWGRLGSEELGTIASAPLWIDASSEINSADLRLRCQTLKRQHGIRCVIVDYVALVEGLSVEAKKDERLRIVEVMRTCAWIAKELKCVVIIAAQLNRETDRNRGKPPVLADLLGSSSIEATAHSILFIHRPKTSCEWHRMSDESKKEWERSYQSRRNAHPECWGDGSKLDPVTGEEYWKTMDSRDEARARQDWEEHAVLYIAKNRRGPTPEVWLRYQEELTWFSGRTPKLYSNNPNERQITK